MDRSDGYRTFPTNVRREILKRDDFQCQVCGRFGPERDGNVDLETRHMWEDPEYVYRDHADNGITMCIPCHHLITYRVTVDDLLPALDDVAAEVNLLYEDIKILVYLYEYGPATTSEIREATSGSAQTSITEWLWTLMSVDRDVGSLDGPLIDKDLDTSGWGCPDDVGRTVRKRVPEGGEELVSWPRDELPQRFLDAGANRSTLVLFFGRSRRAILYIARWVGAIRVPFDGESHPDALVDGDEFGRVVDEMERLFRGSDRSRWPVIAQGKYVWRLEER